MAAFLDICRFTPTTGGTTDWTFATAATGFLSPASAGAVNGRVYKYRAERSDLSQWEIGEGTYNSSGGILTRTTVLFNSSGTTTKINFTVVPLVAIIALKEDLISVEEANNFTINQRSQARANMGVVKRNYIINGAMMISQELGSNPSAVNGSSPVDQWKMFFNNAPYTSARVNVPTPGGSTSRLRVTVTTAKTSFAAPEYAFVQQIIEGVRVTDLLSGTASSKIVVLSFGCKAPAGTYCVAFRNLNADRSYIAEFTIAAGEANTDVFKSVSLRLDQTGTWGNSNDPGIEIAFLFAFGSLFSTPTAGVWAPGNFIGTPNQTNMLATAGNVFELFDVGFYEGSVAPDFQLPDWATELRACQRYYEQIGMTMADSRFAPPYYNTSWYKVTKRAVPTITALNDVQGAIVGIIPFTPFDGMRQIDYAHFPIDSLFGIDARQ